MTTPFSLRPLLVPLPLSPAFSPLDSFRGSHFSSTNAPFSALHSLSSSHNRTGSSPRGSLSKHKDIYVARRWEGYVGFLLDFKYLPVIDKWLDEMDVLKGKKTVISAQKS